MTEFRERAADLLWGVLLVGGFVILGVMGFASVVGLGFLAALAIEELWTLGLIVLVPAILAAVVILFLGWWRRATVRLDGAEHSDPRGRRVLKVVASLAELVLIASCAWLVAILVDARPQFLLYAAVAAGVGVLAWILSQPATRRLLGLASERLDPIMSMIARVTAPIGRVLPIRTARLALRSIGSVLDEPVRTVRQTYPALPELGRAGLEIDAGTNEASGRIAGWPVRITLSGGKARLEIIGLPFRARLEDVQDLAKILEPDGLHVRVGRAFVGIDADPRDAAAGPLIIDQALRLVALAEALSRRSGIAKLREIATSAKEPALQRSAIRVLEPRNEIPPESGINVAETVRLAFLVRAPNSKFPDDAEPWLLGLLSKASEPDVRSDAIRGLSRCGASAVVPELRRVSASATPRERAEIAKAIDIIRARDSSAGAGQLSVAAGEEGGALSMPQPEGALSEVRSAGAVALAKTEK